LIFLQVLPYQFSYVVAFIFGIGLAYLLNRYFVFQADGGRFGFIWMSFIYVGQFILGLGFVSVWVQWLGGSTLLAPLFSVALSLPVTFVLTRRLFRQNPTNTSVGLAKTIQNSD